jgi:hypothetical protein
MSWPVQAAWAAAHQFPGCATKGERNAGPALEEKWCSRRQLFQNRSEERSKRETTNLPVGKKERDMSMRIGPTFTKAIEDDDGKGCTEGSTTLPGNRQHHASDGVESYRASDGATAVPDGDGKGCTDGSTGIPLGKPRGAGAALID